MSNPLYIEIQDQLSSYLAGDIDLEAFEDWITVNGWNSHLQGDSAGHKLRLNIEHLLFEFSDEHSGWMWDEDRLRQELAPLALRPVELSKSKGIGSVPFLPTRDDVITAADQHRLRIRFQKKRKHVPSKEHVTSDASASWTSLQTAGAASDPDLVVFGWGEC